MLTNTEIKNKPGIVVSLLVNGGSSGNGLIVIGLLKKKKINKKKEIEKNRVKREPSRGFSKFIPD